MANETKSSPADHYFEPNGSNANAENIGHVLNDLTDIVASGTPEEGNDSVKWDGENFILGPAGGGDIDAEENQMIVGDGKGSGVGVQWESEIEDIKDYKAYFKNGEIIIKETRNPEERPYVPGEPIPKTSFNLSKTQKQVVLFPSKEDPSKTESRIEETKAYEFMIGGMSKAIIEDESSFIMHDRAQLQLTGGQGRTTASPQVYIHGNSMISMDDEWYNTGTGRYRPIYNTKRIDVRKTTTVSGTSHTMYEIYQYQKEAVQYVQEHIEEYLDKQTITETYYWAYNNFIDTHTKNAPLSLITSKNLEKYFDAPETEHVVAYNSYSKSTSVKDNTTTYNFICSILLADYTRYAKPNIEIPIRWRLEKDEYNIKNSSGRPIISLHGNPIMHMAQESMINMDGTTQIDMHNNSMLQMNGEAKIFMNYAAGGTGRDFTPIIGLNGGRILLNASSSNSEEVPEINLSIGRIQFNKGEYSDSQKGTPQIIMNAGQLLFNPERGYHPEVVFNGGAKLQVGGDDVFGRRYYTECSLWGLRANVGCDWSSRDDFNGINPTNKINGADCPTFEMYGAPIITATGRSNITMHQFAEINNEGRSLLKMSEYSTVLMTKGSKIIMQNNTADPNKSPAIMMTPEQYRIGSVGDYQYGGSFNSEKIKVDDPFTFFLYPFLQFSNGSRIFMENETGGQSFIRIGDDTTGYVKHTNILGYICGQSFFKFSDFSHTELTDNSVFILRGRDRGMTTYPWRDGAGYEKYHNNIIWRKGYDRAWQQGTTGPDCEIYDESVIRIRGSLDFDRMSVKQKITIQNVKDINGNGYNSTAASSLWKSDGGKIKHLEFSDVQKSDQTLICENIINAYEALNQKEAREDGQTTPYTLLSITENEDGTYNIADNLKIYHDDSGFYTYVKETRSDWKAYAAKRDNSPLMEIIENAEIRQHGNTKFILVENDTTIDNEDYSAGLTIKIGNDSAHFSIEKLKELAAIN